MTMAIHPTMVLIRNTAISNMSVLVERDFIEARIRKVGRERLAGEDGDRMILVTLKAVGVAYLLTDNPRVSQPRTALEHLAEVVIDERGVVNLAGHDEREALDGVVGVLSAFEHLGKNHAVEVGLDMIAPL